METLETVIYSLTSDEVRRFKILSNRFKADEEKKLLILFDALRSERYSGSDEDLLMELYGSTDAKTKNRYYRLRNKLLDNIEKSLVFYHFKYKDSIHAYYDVQLAIMFKERGNFELARYFLKKGEKKAEALDQFQILETIYEEYVQLAIRNIDIDIKEILEKRRNNLEKVEIHRNNTEAIAVIKQQLKKSRFTNTKGSVLDLLDNIKQDIEKSANIFHSTEGKILLFQTISTILHSKGAWKQLVEYLKDLIDQFEQEDLFYKDNHSTRLLMRLRLIISLYNSYRLNEANEQLKIFEKEMKMYGKQNYHTYIFNYYNIKIYNLKLLGRNAQVKSTIEEALKIPEIKNNPSNYAIILISLAGQQFNEGDYHGALETIEKIKESRGFSNFDLSLRCYLDIFRMVNLYEVGEYHYNLDYHKKFRKKFRKILKQEEHKKAARFIEVFMRMCNAKIHDKRVSLRAAIKGMIENYERSHPHENEILDPELYFRSKLDDIPYQKLFMDEVRKRMAE